MVVDIQEEGDTKELPPCIVRKSDGAALYATSDLATLVEREKLYQPDAYIYLADKRQELLFTTGIPSWTKERTYGDYVNVTAEDVEIVLFLVTFGNRKEVTGKRKTGKPETV